MAGRGRGRGTPLLPEGMWEALKNETKIDTVVIDVQSKHENADDNDNSVQKVPSGRGRGSMGGRGNNSFSSGGRGGGLKKDVKGTDWNCETCKSSYFTFMQSHNILYIDKL